MGIPLLMELKYVNLWAYRGENPTDTFEVLGCRILTNDAILPKRVTPFATRWYVYAPYSTVIRPGEEELYYIDIALIMNGKYTIRTANVEPRKCINSLLVIGKYIPSTYKDNIKITVVNTSKDKDLKVEKGSNIAQLILERYHRNDA